MHSIVHITQSVNKREYSHWPQHPDPRHDAEADLQPDQSARMTNAAQSPPALSFDEIPTPTTPAADPHARLMTLEEFSEFLAVTPRWVYDNHEPLGIPALRIGRTLRFRRTDVESWLNTRSTRPHPPSAPIRARALRARA
jgi:excisionase family DNA binding protein